MANRGKGRPFTSRTAKAATATRWAAMSEQARKAHIRKMHAARWGKRKRRRKVAA